MFEIEQVYSKSEIEREVMLCLWVCVLFLLKCLVTGSGGDCVQRFREKHRKKKKTTKASTISYRFWRLKKR